MKKVASLILLVSLGMGASAQQVIGGDNSGNGVIRGSDAYKNSNLVRPGDVTTNGEYGNRGIIKVEKSEVITKKEYEASLKNKGLTQEDDLKRARVNRNKAEGIVDDVEYIQRGESISPYAQQKQEIEKEFEDLKKNLKIQGVPEGNDKVYYEKFALMTIKKSEDVLFLIEKDLYTRKIVMPNYEKAERQIQLLNIIVEANYSDSVTKKAEMVKTKSYLLMRQMLPFILQDSVSGSSVNALSNDFKLLKFSTKKMNSSEVLKLKHITENAFAIGFEKVIYTNNDNYAVEEDVKEYIKKIKEDRKSKK